VTPFWTTVAAAAFGSFIAVSFKGILQFFFDGGLEIKRLADQDLTEALALTDAIANAGCDLFEQAAENGSQRGLEAHINGSFVALSASTERLFVAKENLKRKVDVAINSFEDTISSNDFGVETRGPIKAKLRPIRTEAAKLKSTITKHARSLPRKFGSLS
jgi:hypothetical protein